MNGVSKALIFLVLMTAYIVLGLAETVLQLRRRFVEIRQEKLAQAAASAAGRRRAAARRRGAARAGRLRRRDRRSLKRRGERRSRARARPRPSACSCRPPRRRRRRPRRIRPRGRPPAGRAGSEARRSSDRAARPGGGQRDVDAAEQLAADPVEPAPTPSPNSPLSADVQNVSCRHGGLPQTIPTRPPMSGVGHERRGAAADAQLERRPPERSADHGTLEKTEHDAKHVVKYSAS